MIIYKATSKTSGKSYIGKTTNSLSQRRGEHERTANANSSNSHFHNAISKYGKGDFEWSTLEAVNIENDLNLLEIKLIEEHSTFTDGYNQSKGGEGKTGYKFTTEASKNMSESLKKAYRDGRKPSNFTNISEDSVKRIRDGAREWANENTKGEKNGMWGNGNPISVEGTIYTTMREAAAAVGVHHKTIKYRLGSSSTKFSNYFRV